MGFNWSNIAAAPTASTNGYVVSVDMKVGDYTLAATVPAFGARHVTCTRTATDTADTPGTLVVIGTDLSGQTITETLTVGASTVLVVGTKFFASVSKVTGVGWVIDAVEGTKDKIIVGWDAQNAVATSSGVFHGIQINTAVASAITVADARGTIATIPANATGFIGPYDVQFSGYLRVEPAGASNLTVMHSGSLPAYSGG